MPEATTARPAKQAQRTAKPIPMGPLEREVFQRESVRIGTALPHLGQDEDDISLGPLG